MKHIDSVADLVRFGAAVVIECGGCGAARTLSGTEMAKQCGTGSLRTARARLRCSRCGEKGAKLAVLPPV